ncbi:MAG: CoA-binding protein [Magnetococcales bacterium]|nr:CoA-binding protein [Magnetococcales bacterium]
MSKISDSEIIDLLKSTKTIAVVGLSPKPDRASHRVALYMQQAGYRVIPVRPGGATILGEQSYPSLEEIPEDIQVDLVDVFRKGEDTPPIAAAAVAIKAKGFWLQLGITNQTSMETAKKGGVIAVENLCLMVEHLRLASKL